MISKFIVFFSERPTFKETTKRERRDDPPYLCRPAFHGMNYSWHWIFMVIQAHFVHYCISNVQYQNIITYVNVFVYAIIIMNTVVKQYFVILKSGTPIWTSLEPYVKCDLAQQRLRSPQSLPSLFNIPSGSIMTLFVCPCQLILCFLLVKPLWTHSLFWKINTVSMWTKDL